LTAPTSERSAADLASTVLDALQQAEIARERLDTSPESKDFLAGSVTRMTSRRFAKRRFQDARALFVAELKSPKQAVNLVGTVFTSAFEALEHFCDRGITLEEAMHKVKTQEDVAKMASDLSALAADADEAWRLLPKGVIALSFALVDDERLTDGKLQHLRLSAAERASLIGRINREYPNAGKKSGGHAIEVSASLLLQFLRGGHKSANE
jgi:hypothetical protein